jgi:hypothetical protein
MLQRAGLRDSLFIAMSNFHYEEKRTYLTTLAAVRAGDHDLTPFLKFALRGVALQSERLTGLIRNPYRKRFSATSCTIFLSDCKARESG